MTAETNAEPTVKCPVEACDAEKLKRGIHLHVRQSKGNGHGAQGEVPSGIDLNGLETTGSQEVSMDYPETRKTEQVGRLCPYCEETFRGKQGIMIHLGRVAGQDMHPENPSEEHEPKDFDVVHMDDSGAVIETAAGDSVLPSTKKRRQQEGTAETIPEQRVRQYISDLRVRGKHEEAERATEMLFQ